MTTKKAIEIELINGDETIFPKKSASLEVWKQALECIHCRDAYDKLGQDQISKFYYTVYFQLCSGKTWESAVKTAYYFHGKH